MSGKPINSEQVKIYMKTRNVGKTQATAAAKAGISERTGRRIEKGELYPGNTSRNDIGEQEPIPSPMYGKAR